MGGKAYLRLIYLGMKADLKARKECNRFNNRYYLCKKMCERCDAVQLKSNQDHPMNYKNMSGSAPYLETCITHEEYMRLVLRLAHGVWSPDGSWRTYSLTLCIWFTLEQLVPMFRLPSKFFDTWGISMRKGSQRNCF